MRTLTIGPAFGRDYPSRGKALADWYAGNTFQIHDMFVGGRYLSSRDKAQLLKDGIGAIHLRYHMMTKVIVIKLT